MSRELLKRALSAIMSVRGFPSSIAIDTMQAIEAELNKPEPEPVAWVGTGLLPVSSEEIMRMKMYEPGTAALYDTPLYTTPPDQSARVAELEKSETFLTECTDAAINDREYYEQKFKEAKADYDECSQAVFWLGKERDDLKLELTALQAKREPLSDDEIRDCAESENLPYFENKEEFDAFARAIEAAHNIGINHE